MTEPAEVRSVIIERELAFPPEKIWRALTTPYLIVEWLMKNDFAPVTGHNFTLRTEPRGDWDGRIDCKVIEIEPEKALSYTWDSGNGALRVTSIVSWTLTPTHAGTLLRMEQSGFRSDQSQNYQGAGYGWQHFFARLEEVLGRAG